MIRRPPRSTQSRSSAASDVYKRQVWGWLLYSFNPSVPLIAVEMRVTKAVAGLHGTAIAAGVILAGILTPRLVERFGRQAVLVLAGPVVAAGTLMLITGPGIAWTMGGVFVVAASASIAVGAAQAGLVMRHHGRSSASVAEANGVGSTAYTHLRAHETRHDLVCRLLLEK